MEDWVYFNEHYGVKVGEGEDYDSPHYLIVNKNTEVVEVESRLFPQSVAYCDQLSESYEDCLNPESNVNLDLESGVTSINKNH